LLEPIKPTSSAIYENITRRREQLEKYIDGRFGLDSELLAVRLLDRDECETVRSKLTCRKQNKKMVAYILKKPEAETVKFLEALSKNWQQHVVNFVLDVRGQ